MPSLRTLINGREGLPGPLSQLGLGRDGTFYVIAAGRANHAGRGEWRGVVNGNSNFIGIEAENTGRDNDLPWPEVQIDAYQRGVAAILKHIGRGEEFCAGHKEYALPRRRKVDPRFDSDDHSHIDMDRFRANVAAILAGTAPPPRLIPAVEPSGLRATPGRPTLRRGMTGPLTAQVQAKVGVAVDGKFGAITEAAVRAFQRARGLVADGIVGPKTWAALDAA